MRHFILLFTFLPFLSFAQPTSEIEQAVSDVRTFIQAGRLAQAENLVNRYIQDDPLNVDLLMMKGNVELNKFIIRQQAQASLIPNFDESIYNMGTVEKGPHPVTVPIEVADKVSYLWNGAATLKPSRADLHLGLLQVYAISKQREKVLDYLPKAKAEIGDLENLFADLTTYAVNLRERGDTVGGKMVWEKIIELYPEQPGLMGDLAAEYFFEGDAKGARGYISKSLSSPNADETLFGNAFFFSSIMGDYDNALSAIRKLPGDGNFLYEGLVKYYQKEKKWKKSFEKFLENPQDSLETKVANTFLAKNFSLDLDTYFSLVEMDLGDPIKILLHEIFRTSGEFIPNFSAAETYTYHKQYKKATAIFQEIESADMSMSEADRENFLFYGAYAYSQNGQRKKADDMWRQLMESEDFYKKSAAHWFVGKYLFDQGKKIEAREVFQNMAGLASESKFATMCWNYMGVE